MVSTLKCILSSLFALSAHGAEYRFQSAGNPLFDGADPDVLWVDGTFWVYPTGGAPSDGPAFFAFSSPDLKTWTRHGPVLRFKDVGWILDDGAPRRYAWAPGMLHHKGSYYLYFSAGPNTPKPSRIGVAVSKSPSGPFVDCGHVLINGGNGFEAIDAKPFAVPGTNQVLLYCGGSAGAKLKVYELDSTLTAVARKVQVDTPPMFTEGAFIHERNGVFYFSYSSGNYRDATYSVHYCTSSTPTGPWKYEGKILTSDSNHLGPGHHAILHRPDTGEWLFFYHRWNNAARNGKLPESRSVCVEPLKYDVDGKILPIHMTSASNP